MAEDTEHCLFESHLPPCLNTMSSLLTSKQLHHSTHIPLYSLMTFVSTWDFNCLQGLWKQTKPTNCIHHFYFRLFISNVTVLLCNLWLTHCCCFYWQQSRTTLSNQHWNYWLCSSHRRGKNLFTVSSGMQFSCWCVQREGYHQQHPSLNPSLFYLYIYIY